jgi:hypothetical protein
MLRKRIRGNITKALTFLALTLGDGLLVLFAYYFLLGNSPSYGNLWYLTPLVLLSNIYYTYTYGGGIILTLFVMLMNQWPLFFVVMKKPITIILPILAIVIKFAILHCFNDKKKYYLGGSSGQESLTYNCKKGSRYSSLSLKNVEKATDKEIIFEKSEDFWKVVKNNEKILTFKSVECMDGNPMDNLFAANAKINHYDPAVICEKTNKLIIFFTNDKSIAEDYLRGFSGARGENLFLLTDNPDVMFLRRKLANNLNFKSFLLSSGALNRDVNDLLQAIGKGINNRSLVFIDCYRVNQFNFADYLMLILRLRASIPVSRWCNVSFQGISFTDGLLNVLKKINFLGDPALFNLVIPAEIYRPGLESGFFNTYLNESIAFIDPSSFVAALNYCANISDPELLANKHFVLKIRSIIPTHEIVQGVASYHRVPRQQFHLIKGGPFFSQQNIENDMLARDNIMQIPDFNYHTFLQEQVGKTTMQISKNLQKLLTQIYPTKQD